LGANSTGRKKHGNTIRVRELDPKKNLLILGLCTLGIGALVFIPRGSIYRIIVVALFVILLISFLFPLYAYVIFSQRGGRLQEKFYDLIIQSLGEDVRGRILDIGSGNGVLAVKLARQYGDVQVVGID